MTTIDQPIPAAAPAVPRLRRVLGGVALGAAAAVAGIVAWVLINKAVSFEMGWIAIAVGALIGAATAFGAASTSRIAVPIVAVVLTLVSAVLADNFLQRSNLVDGIAKLQAQWSDLRIEPVVIPQAPPPTEPGASSTSVPPDQCPDIAKQVPPLEIVKVLPLAAYDCMPAETLAIIYDDVPDEIKPKLPAQLKADAEAIIAEDAATERQDQAQSELEAARAAFSETDFDIPEPVLVCAPPPDFTQPDAASGIGFPGGVPLVLPLGDLFSDERVRGDGQVYEAPSPVCFARENAKEHPVQAASWGIGAILAGVVAFVMRRRRGDVAGPSGGPDVSGAGASPVTTPPPPPAV